MSKLRLAVVILNYRTPQLVCDCLATLEPELDFGQDGVWVVDNNSCDGSVALIEQHVAQQGWQSWVTVIDSGVNDGFSSGNNIGLLATNAEFYLLCNSDTLIRPNAIPQMLEAFKQHPEVGMVSPRLEWPNADPQISCFRYKSPISELIDASQTGPITKIFQRYDVPIPVSNFPLRPDWTSFACVMLRYTAVAEVGLMDEGYFMYFEDVDYCRRLKMAGWDILHWPQAHVVHLRGGSSNVKAATALRKRRPGYYYASRARYFTKFYGFFGFYVANLLWGCGRTIALLREVVGNKPPHTCAFESQDIWVNWVNPLDHSKNRPILEPAL